MSDLAARFAAASVPAMTQFEAWIAAFTPEVRAAWDAMLVSPASTQTIVELVKTEGIPVGKDTINAHRKAARERSGRKV